MLRSRLGVTLSIFMLFCTIQITLLPVYSSDIRSTFGNTSVQPQSELRVVRIRTTDATERKQLSAAGIDLLEHSTKDALFAMVTPAQQRALAAAGWSVDLDTDKTTQIAQTREEVAAFRDGYHTVQEIEDFVNATAENYPHLAERIDFGDSWEKTQDAQKGHDLLALRLTNTTFSGPKPVFVLMAAIHAREIVTSELAMRYATYLLEQYGKDAEATWLLDDYDVIVIPLANPDGRDLVEQGLLQRKNRNSNRGECASPPTINDQFGVDLNRNFMFAWGMVNGPSTPPCSETFPGTSAASEPETQAIQDFLRSLFPDQRGASDDAAAADTTSGIVISLHSYSNLVLWPWGYTSVPTANSAAFTRLGRTFAQFNGYTAQQAVDLYPSSGTLEDWLYGERGIATFTFEVGPASGVECATFFPPFTCLDGGAGGKFWPLNLPAFLYANSIASAPYTQPFGPTITTVAAISDTTTLTLTATIDSSATGQPVAAGELYLNSSPLQAGEAFPLVPLDGMFNTTIEKASVHLPIASITPDARILVRGKNTEWGLMKVLWLKDAASQNPQRYSFMLPIVRKK